MGAQIILDHVTCFLFVGIHIEVRIHIITLDCV